MTDTFLTAEEVAELTGIKIGRDGKTRETLQAEHLRQAGIPFYLNARGRPIIVRANLTGNARVPIDLKPAWQPRVIKHAA